MRAYLKGSSAQMKLSQRVLSKFLVVGLFLCSLQAWSAPMAKVLRAGSGRINATHAWPEGYSFKASGAKKKYSVRRLEEKEFPKVSERVRRSWDVSQFTNLSSLAQGTELEEFQVVVHGLELKVLQPSLTSMSFDDFVAQQFNPTVPRGIDFVRFYPYFFHKKTVISASIVNAFNTATFGYSGFILSVPKENYLACSEVDMHTPTDRDFYSLAESTPRASAAAESMSLSEMLRASLGVSEAPGPVEMMRLYQEHRLVNLLDFLPQEKVKTGGTPARKTPAASASARGGEDAMMLALLQSMGASHLAGGVGTRSWYNEVAISPISPTREAVEISGVFIRADRSDRALEEVMAKPEVRVLLELAEVYNLPVLQIYDGQYYETDVGE